MRSRKIGAGLSDSRSAAAAQTTYSYKENMGLFSMFQLIVGLLIVAVIGVVVKQVFFPHRYKMEDPAFDLRATNLPDDLGRDAVKFARIKALAKQRYTLKLTKPNKHKILRTFFPGQWRP